MSVSDFFIVRDRSTPKFPNSNFTLTQNVWNNDSYWKDCDFIREHVSLSYHVYSQETPLQVKSIRNNNLYAIVYSSNHSVVIGRIKTFTDNTVWVYDKYVSNQLYGDSV